MRGPFFDYGTVDRAAEARGTLQKQWTSMFIAEFGTAVYERLKKLDAGEPVEDEVQDAEYIEEP